MAEKMVTVRYVGPLPRVSAPCDQSQMVENGGTCEVPESCELGTHWERAKSTKKKSSKQGADGNG